MKKVIELQNIKRDFQVGEETVHALRGVSFTINEGEFVTIMGTSGSGKSTLLNTLGCLDTPTSGEYLLDDISVRTMSKPQRAVLRNRKIGFVFQSYNLLPKTTAVENVELPLMYNSSVSASERRRRAIEALQAVGLGDRLEHKSNQMSGGQMQRVAIARALVNNPAVILAMSKPQRAVLRNRKIGFVFQSYNLLPKTTAVENVELPLMYNSSVSASERRRRAIEALQAVGLGDRLEHKSNQMSGGQMQRVAIARALVNNPAVILADEATGNLDTRTSFDILVLFQKLHAEGRTIIFVTHNPEIAQYSSRNIRLRDGHVIEDTVNTHVLSAAEALAALPKSDED